MFDGGGHSQPRVHTIPKMRHHAKNDDRMSGSNEAVNVHGEEAAININEYGKKQWAFNKKIEINGIYNSYNYSLHATREGVYHVELSMPATMCNLKD